MDINAGNGYYGKGGGGGGRRAVVGPTDFYRRVPKEMTEVSFVCVSLHNGLSKHKSVIKNSLFVASEN